MRYGLCCISLILAEKGIRFKKMTFKTFSNLPRKKALKKLYEIWTNNVQTLKATIRFCEDNNISRYRIASDIFPLATHPMASDILEIVSFFDEIESKLIEIGKSDFCKNVGLSFHPSQFISIVSAKETVRIASAKEINFNSQILDLLSSPADIRAPINIHLNRTPTNIDSFNDDFKSGLSLLTRNARQRLTIENEDRGFWNVQNLLTFLKPYKIPILLDLHHDRINSSRLSQSEAMKLAAETWNPFTPIFHISEGVPNNPRKHSDFCKSIPNIYDGECVFMVEAKAKDYAIKKLLEISL